MREKGALEHFRGGRRIPDMRTRLLTLVLLCGIFSCKASFASDLVLVHARIYTSPTEKPIDDGTVVIHDGKIRAVGPSSTTKGPRFARLVTVVDCTGMTITAGLWNSHVHILTEDFLHADQKSAAQLTTALQAMLTRWGFTTVFDTASILTNTSVVRRRIASGEVLGPKILTVGDPFYPENGVPVYIQGFLKDNHIQLPEDHSDSEAVTRVRRQIGDGADGIKIFAGSIENDGVLLMPLSRAKAIVAEAHRLGRPVFAHPSNEQGVDLALDSGVDVLAHVALMGGPWSPSLVERMKTAHIALIPTLTLFDVEAKKARVSPEEDQQWIDLAVHQLKVYAEAGGQILFGTDVGYTDHFDTAEEYTLMKQAGMTFPQVLASLTTNPAERFGASGHTGRIAKHMDADLTVLDGDPVTDIAAFSRVHYTIRNGRIIYKESH